MSVSAGRRSLPCRPRKYLVSSASGIRQDDAFTISIGPRRVISVAHGSLHDRGVEPRHASSAKFPSGLHIWNDIEQRQHAKFYVCRQT